MNAATKTGIDAAKTASKRAVKKLQKLQEILSEIKQLIKLRNQAKQKVKKIRIKDNKSTYHQKKDNKLLMT